MRAISSAIRRAYACGPVPRRLAPVGCQPNTHFRPSARPDASRGRGRSAATRRRARSRLATTSGRRSRRPWLPRGHRVSCAAAPRQGVLDLSEETGWVAGRIVPCDRIQVYPSEASGPGRGGVRLEELRERSHARPPRRTPMAAGFDPFKRLRPIGVPGHRGCEHALPALGCREQRWRPDIGPAERCLAEDHEDAVVAPDVGSVRRQIAFAEVVRSRADRS